MKRKSILLVLCIGMILTSCESKISLNSTDVKNEKNQKNTTMENPDKGYNLPIDEDKKKEAVNDCEEIMGIVRDIYSEYNGIQEEKGSVILYEADTDGGITRKEYSYDGKEMSVMSAKMIWSEDTEPVLTYISLSKIKEWAYTENGNFCYELCVPEPPEVTEIVDGSCIIRVKPLSEECREYSKKYVSTFGYQGNNLLCSNWNAEDMQGLDYNGLYEYFYQMKYGEKFTAEKEVVGIPAEEFENVIMTYLPVTKEELKEWAVYDEQSNMFIWERLGCGNYSPTHFGLSLPEVTEVRHNEDGTIVLTIHAVCDSVVCNDAVITHELTMKIQDDGTIQYVGNRILDNGIDNIPRYQYRLGNLQN